MSALWQTVGAALDRASERGRTLTVWLRDDDAIAETAALARLATVCERHGMPVLLAVIPALAEPSLARFVERHALITPTQHGYAHINHADKGERARELCGTQPPVRIFDELARGRERLASMFARTAGILVPPWNRIDADLVPGLPALGFTALSTFGAAGPPVPGLDQLNCQLDIIDWRNGRVGHTHAKLVGKLVDSINTQTAATAPLGLLTHHLVHDETAWSFLEDCLAFLAGHPAVRFASAEELLPTR